MAAIKTVVLSIVAAGAMGSALLFSRHQGRLDALMQADPEQILSQPDLARTALDLGRPAYARRCAGCHGQSGGGKEPMSAPALSYGGRLYDTARPDDVEQIILYGIRSGNPRSKHLASMPAYARPKPYLNEPIPPLSPAEIADLTQFVLSLSGRQSDAAAAARGSGVYQGKGGCYDCHGADARGDPAIGAPTLIKPVWLYGDGSARSIAESIAYGRAGICPAFARHMTPLEARAIAIYVVSLQQRPPERALR